MPVVGSYKCEGLCFLGHSNRSHGRVQEGFIKQEKGRRDRRQRLLSLTDRGETLFAELSSPQKKRVARAYRQAGAEAVAGYRRVLADLLNSDEREAVLKSVERS